MSSNIGHYAVMKFHRFKSEMTLTNSIVQGVSNPYPFFKKSDHNPFLNIPFDC